MFIVSVFKFAPNTGLEPVTFSAHFADALPTELIRQPLTKFVVFESFVPGAGLEPTRNPICVFANFPGDQFANQTKLSFRKLLV